MAIFGPKPWVNPFGKMSIFQLFEIGVFFRLEGRFFVLEYRKRHFPSLIRVKKRLEKRPFLDQKHGLTPLEKYEFFTLINLWFFFLERRFLVLEYRKRHFPAQFCQKKRSWKNDHL